MTSRRSGCASRAAHRCRTDVQETFERLTGCSLVEGYGLSETSPVACCNPPLGTSKAGSIGIPAPQTIIEIISMDDRVTPVKPGEAGELCIRGPQVMTGYWEKPEETEFAMVGGRFHSGDIATMDDEGYVYHCRPAEGHRHRLGL